VLIQAIYDELATFKKRHSSKCVGCAGQGKLERNQRIAEADLEKFKAIHGDQFCVPKFIHDTLRNQHDQLIQAHNGCANKVDSSVYDNLRNMFDQLTQTHKVDKSVHEARERELDELAVNQSDGAGNVPMQEHDELEYRHEQLEASYNELVVAHNACGEKINKFLLDELELQLREAVEAHLGCEDLQNRFDQLQNEHSLCTLRLSATLPLPNSRQPSLTSMSNLAELR
jgi:hypothetical protein